jgi:hypothetical protein
MLVFRGVAAPDVAAAQTQTEMHPAVPQFEALFTALGFRLHAANLIEVGTIIGHVGLLWVYNAL